MSIFKIEQLKGLLQDRSIPLIGVINNSDTNISKTVLKPFDGEQLQKQNEEEKEEMVKVSTSLTCPVTDCEKKMKPDDVMAHFVHCHKEVKIERVFDDDAPPLGITVDYQQMFLNNAQVFCLKLLAFGGRVGQRQQNLPIIGCRKVENKGLPNELKHLSYDLPIIILGTRTFVQVPLQPEHKGVPHYQNMLIIWPVTIETTTMASNIFCRIFTLQPDFMAGKRTIVEMLSFKDSEWPDSILERDPHSYYLPSKYIDHLDLRARPLVIGIKLKFSIFSSISVDLSSLCLKAAPEKDSDEESNKTFTIN